MAKDDDKASVGRDQVKKWLGAINASLRREKDWRKDGRDCVRLYEGRMDTSFNVLYSNTETLSPALYSATPKPAVMRRYKNDDDLLAKAGAEVLNRSLTYQMDTNGDSQTDFDDLMDDIVLAALVPGRGQVWYRYEAAFEQEAAPLKLLDERDSGKAIAPSPPVRKVTDETIHREMVPWDQYTQGYAKQWKDVPWVARSHHLTKDELMTRFEEHGANVTCTAMEVLEEEGKNTHTPQEIEGAPNTATVWEIWDRTTKKVWFVTDGFAECPLDIKDDPLNLSGFFPCPKPLAFTRQLSGMTPQTLYQFYKEQAVELEEVTVRLKRLVKAMRIRGMYNAMIDDIADVLDAEENSLKPITNAATLEGRGLKDSVWLVPIQDYVPVIQELWTQREQLKKVIYEITGISDIIRGSTVASETATAQDIKSRWGTLRLQTMQKRVQKFARSMLRIESEIMCKLFDQKKFLEMTDLDFPTAEQKAMAQQQLQHMQESGEQVPPDAAKFMQTPTWEDVLGFLKKSVLRMYRLDIETDSTLADSIKADQEEITGMLTGVTQLIQGLTPAVQGGFLSFETAKGILIGVVRRFRLGSDLETALDQAQQPPPPQEDQGKAEAQKLAAEQQKQQMEMQAQQAEAARVQAQEDRQAEMAAREMDMQLKKAQMDMDMARMQREREYAEQEHQTKMRELQLKADLAAKQVMGKLAVIAAQTATAEAKAKEPAPKPGE